MKSEVSNQAPNRALPPTVWKLGWISFLADVSSEMVYPLIPVFLTQVLRAPAMALGFIEGSAEAIVSVMKGWSGWHSDQTRRRVPYIRWGYGLSALGKPLIGLSGGWGTVLAARVADRIGKGVRTSARDALLADSVDKSQYGRAFGFHRSMDTAGAFLGSTLALLIVLLAPADLRLIFFLAGIPGALSLWVALRLNEAQAKQCETSAEVAQLSFGERLRTMPRGYWVALVTTMLFALANSSDTFLLLRASQLGLSTPMVILAYIGYNVTFALTSYPAGVLSDRLGRWTVICAGWLLYALVYVGFAFSGPAMLWPLFAIYGVYMGLAKGAASALIADFAPAASRGTAMGLFHMSSGLATLVASAIVGLIWDRLPNGPQTAFLLDAGLAVIAVAFVPVALRMKPRST